MAEPPLAKGKATPLPLFSRVKEQPCRRLRSPRTHKKENQKHDKGNVLLKN